MLLEKLIGQLMGGSFLRRFLTLACFALVLQLGFAGRDLWDLATNTRYIGGQIAVSLTVAGLVAIAVLFGLTFAAMISFDNVVARQLAKFIGSNKR